MKRRQQGQALPLGLALALASMLGALVLYNTGRLATDKTRLANAADAAAYSGLLWQARAMNFQAYTNRAMVANQVSIAQAVSLQAWTAHGSKAAERIAMVLRPFGPLAAFGEGISAVMTAIDSVVRPVSEVMVGVIDLVNRGVGHAQQAMFVTSFAATPDIVTAVARESDPRFDAETLYGVGAMGHNFAEWSEFTTRYDADDTDVMASRVDLVNDARDDFTRERKWRLFKNFWFYSTLFTRHRIFRDGGTRLVMVEGPGGPEWEWQARDTTSLLTRYFRPFRSEGKMEEPIGWGAAHANERGGESISENACRRSRGTPAAAQCGYWTTNKKAERWAQRDTRGIRGYHGINAFRSLAAGLEGLETGDPIVSLRTEVALATPDVRSSGTFVDGEMLRADVVAPGDRVSSISAAELYYRRPDEARGAALSDEGATGYNPYWAVRLSPVSDEQRLIAIATRGLDSGTRTPAGADGPIPASEDTSLPDYTETLPSSGGAAPGFDRFEAGDFVDEGLADFDPDDPGSLIEDRLGGALEHAADDLAAQQPSSADEGELRAAVDEAVANGPDEGDASGEAMAAEARAARERVDARMAAIQPELVRWMQARIAAPTFAEDHEHDRLQGYDVPALFHIAAVLEKIGNEELPERPITRLEAIEVAKVYYDDMRQEIRSTTTTARAVRSGSHTTAAGPSRGLGGSGDGVTGDRGDE